MALETKNQSQTSNGTKPLASEKAIPSSSEAEDEERRLREVLSKKKIIQKQVRRKHSSDHKAPAPETSQQNSNNGKAAAKPEIQTAEGSDGKAKVKAQIPINTGKDGKPGRNNRRSRRRRRRNRAARIATRNIPSGGGRCGPLMPDSRSYYGGGGGPDRRGPSGPAYYGGDGGSRWESGPRGRGPYRPYGRGGYFGAGADDHYWGDRGRRGERDTYGPSSRVRSPPDGSNSRRGRSRSVSSRSHSRSLSRSSRSMSSYRSRSRSRSYSSRSRSSRSSRRRRSRSYSRSISRSRSRSVASRSYSRSTSRSRSPSPLSGSDKKRKRRDSNDSGDDVRARSRGETSKNGSNIDSNSGRDKAPRNGNRRSPSPSPPPRDDKNVDNSRPEEGKEQNEAESALSKDQRTVFVSQLVMRADERDIRRYFKRKVGAKVRDVILLRDKRTGRHKGCAYVELGGSQDVQRALEASGKNPDFQRFPILIKRTEAEKNYTDAMGLGIVNGSADQGGTNLVAASPFISSFDTSSLSTQLTADGRRIESQKVYVGSIDRCVTQAQIFALFSHFGPLDKVLLQMDPTTGISRGFAFLSFRDPKDANLAIQTMSGQLLAGRSLKTGWANQQSSVAGVEEVRSDQFPADANEKIKNVHNALTQLTGAGLVTMLPQADPSQQQALLAGGPTGALGILPTAQVVNVAEAALNMALGENNNAGAPQTDNLLSSPPTSDPKTIGRSENPSNHILVHNMFDKDEETEQGWEADIKLDFEEECAQYGKIVDVKVMSNDPGGMIYASFDSIEGASNCAKNLAGRWFDKRQLSVEFVESIPL